MKTIEIRGDNRRTSPSKIREASRGIILCEDQILLSYAHSKDLWMIPGGGMEKPESREECCIRELAEETGYIVRPIRHFLTIDEYYNEWLYRSYYYTCEPVDKIEPNLTKAEKCISLETRWVPLKKALEIFSKHQNYIGKDEIKYGSYLREYSALLELGAIIKYS